MKTLSAAILILLIISISYLTFGKLGIPDGLTAVSPFELSRLEGDWYEIARLDHGFEKGYSHVIYRYELSDDGRFTVENKAFDTRKGRMVSSKGKGSAIDDATIGRLKVSYFGPFYGSFNIIALDQEHYQWMMATGPSRHYFWIFSRSQTLDDKTMQELIRQAVASGFKLEKMVYVDQKSDPAAAATPAPTANTP